MISLIAVNDALVQGFDGITLSDGSILAADKKPDQPEDISDDLLPFLLFDIGRMEFEPWQEWQKSVSWDVSATLKVRGEAGEVDNLILNVIQDVLAQSVKLIGLPVDENGVVTPYDSTTRRLFETGRLKFLVERGAPYLKSAVVKPSRGSYAEANLVFHVETTIDLDPRGELPRMLVGVIGVNQATTGIAQDTTLPDPLGIAIVSANDQHAQGAYDTPDPNRQRRPQMPYVQGAQQIVTSVNATPYTASLSVGAPTIQLSAIATYASWQTLYVTGQGGWASSDPTKATVSATGLVTRVAAGTTTITCTSNGVVSNGVAITCT